MWLCGPHRPTTRLAVPEAPLLCSSMCPLLPLFSPPRIGSHVRLFMSFTVSIDATRHRESCPSQLWVVPHLTRTATPLFLFCLPPPFESSTPTSRRPPTPCSFRAPPTARARPMLHRRAFPLSRNVVTASPHPPPPSHVPHVRVDAERRRGQHSSWLEPSALHGHGTGVRRRRKPRGASRKGLFRPAMPRSSRCWSGPRQASTSTQTTPKKR